MPQFLAPSSGARHNPSPRVPTYQNICFGGKPGRKQENSVTIPLVLRVPEHYLLDRFIPSQDLRPIKTNLSLCLVLLLSLPAG